jgi:cell division protease FtsH
MFLVDIEECMIINDEEKKTTAYHESGHALVAKLLPNADPIHKVTIIPRGRALGLTQQLPIDDKHTYTKDYLLDNISILMGGRIAEEIALKTQTTGASNDIERATDIARKMVCEYGMSEKLGPLSFGKKEEEIFLGREITQHKDYSEETARKIDQEINNLINENYKKTVNLLKDNFTSLNNLAKALLEKETLSGQEIDEIMGKKTKKRQTRAKKTKKED